MKTKTVTGWAGEYQTEEQLAFAAILHLKNGYVCPTKRMCADMPWMGKPRKVRITITVEEL